MIPMDQCKHGGLYRISSRNLDLGVYNSNSQGFVGIREKFGYNYLFTEYHWDTGPPFGTVHPKEFLEDCPIAPNETVKTIADAKYFETRQSNAKLGDEVSVENAELFEWLVTKEKQYCNREVENPED
jgi:hypothetical protein